MAAKKVMPAPREDSLLVEQPDDESYDGRSGGGGTGVEGEGEAAFDQGFSEKDQDELDLEAGKDPEEDETEETERAFIQRLDALGALLFDYRKRAIEYRIQIGIEDEWRAAQDSYEGYDDVNRPVRDNRRHAFQTRAHGIADRIAPRPEGSTVFLNITRPYTDASAARVADMLFPTDERPWALQATPVPSLVAEKNSQKPGVLPDGTPVMRADGTQATEGELIQKIIDQAAEKAERAEKRIEDWLVEHQWHAEARMVVNSAARLGTGVLKGPTPSRKRKVAFVGGELQVQEEIVPKSKSINPWNLFPDECCGDNIHNGSYIFERDDITFKALSELRGMPGYIDSQIDECLSEGPQLPTTETSQYAPRTDSQANWPFDIWYYTGDIKRSDLEAIGGDTSQMQRHESVSVLMTMVNNRVIKAALNPLDSGEFPYDVLTWQAREDYWAGIGVAKQIDVPQRGVNAATRAMMNNAGVTSGPQIVLLEDVIEPADGSGNYRITPLKVWKAKRGADIASVKDAFMAINLDSHQAELMAIVEFYLKMAEDVTGLPMIMQGQPATQGRAAETVGGMAMLQNNASSVLRRLAHHFDDRITEPHIGRYYDWLMQYGEDDEEKGDFSIDARASSVLVERDIANNAVMTLTQLSLEQSYGADPRKAYAEACKANKLDPSRFQYNDEEWERIQAAQQEAPTDPRIEVAKLRGEIDERMLAMEQRYESDQAEKNRQFEGSVKKLESEIKIADLQGRGTISTDKIRSAMAGIAMNVQSKERLAREERALKLNEKNRSGTGI